LRLFLIIPVKILLDKVNSADYSYYDKEKRMINETDKRILQIIQEDARITNADIARQVGLAPSAVLERVRKLEERGVIKGYATEICPKEVGVGLTVFVFVRTSENDSGVEAALVALPEVLEAHEVAGEDCLLLKIRTSDTEELGRLLREKIKPIPNVLSTRTTVVLHTFKETTALPLDAIDTSNGAKQKRKDTKSKNGAPLSMEE
jgi:Lrp/AsnC family leucine-responsive transcriptional regulator